LSKKRRKEETCSDRQTDKHFDIMHGFVHAS